MKKGMGIISCIIGILFAVAGIVMKVKGTMAVSVIGGADGPTSVFVAGKLNGDMANVFIIAGAVILGIVLLVYWKKRS